MAERQIAHEHDRRDGWSLLIGASRSISGRQCAARGYWYHGRAERAREPTGDLQHNSRHLALATGPKTKANPAAEFTEPVPEPRAEALHRWPLGPAFSVSPPSGYPEAPGRTPSTLSTAGPRATGPLGSGGRCGWRCSRLRRQLTVPIVFELRAAPRRPIRTRRKTRP